MSNFSNQVTDGMEVFDANQDKIGTVHEVYDVADSDNSASGGGYLRVPTGFLGMGTEHHIPFSAIRDVRDAGIYLNLSKERLDEMGYDSAPVEDEDFDGTTVERTTTTMTEATSPTADVSRTPSSGDGLRKLQLREEELIARKRSVESGEVRVATQIVSEQRTLEVPLARDEVTIERHPVDRRPSDSPIGEEATIDIPVHREEVTLEKRPVVYEEVNVGTRAVQETEQVSATVRREEATIDSQGEVDLDQDSTSPSVRRP